MQACEDESGNKFFLDCFLLSPTLSHKESIKNSDSAIQPLRFRCSDGRMIALAVDSVQGLSYMHMPTATPSRGAP